MAIRFPRVNYVTFQEAARDYYAILSSVLRGHIATSVELTLDTGAASSTLTNSEIKNDSFIGFMPTTANAAAEIANGTLYVSARAKGSATITHANNAQADRTFQCVVLG